jgi:glutaminyl-peptide cyclotransferase
MLLQYLLLQLTISRRITDKFSTSKAKDLRKLHQKTPNLSVKGPLLEPILIPRVSGSSGNKSVQNHIIKIFTELQWHIDQDQFIQETPFGEIEFNNIIVTKDIGASSRFVLAAHFDSKYFKHFDFIGAIDSAAPCAILLDIAIALNEAFDKRKKDGIFTNSTLQIIFFDGEEAMIEWTENDSIYGARHLANRWINSRETLVNSIDGSLYKKSPIQMIEAMVLLDLLGTKEASISNSQTSTQWIWDRLVLIEEKLSVLGLLSEYLINRNKRGQPFFKPGRAVIPAYAIQVYIINLG